MAVYTQPSAPESVDPVALAAELRALVAKGEAYAHSLSDEAAGQPLIPGKWSIQQTFGHLIDSALNNQQRLVRLQLEPTIHLPGYEQDGWVRVQRYDLLPWAEVIALWRTLNLHFAHTLQHADHACMAHLWHTADGEQLTLSFILEDYIAHLRYHLERFPGFPAER